MELLVEVSGLLVGGEVQPNTGYWQCSTAPPMHRYACLTVQEEQYAFLELAVCCCARQQSGDVETGTGRLLLPPLW
jgi:hypothetical protein